VVTTTDDEIPEPVATKHGLRYPCPTCGTLHEWATTAIICLLTHDEED
jgi:hypothetical protein